MKRPGLIGLSVVLAMAMAVGWMLSGCKGGSAAGGKPKVALIMKSLANDFFKDMQDGAEAHAKANADKYELQCHGIKDEKDIAGQVQLVKNMIAQRVDMIVITPVNSEALIPVLKDAMDAGIVVTNIDNQLEADKLAARGMKIPFFGPSNYEGAKLAGLHVASKLSKGDPVMVIQGMPGTDNSRNRTRGFEDAMKQAGINIVDSQSGEWEAAPAMSKVSNMLISHPEVKAILCANDNMALGALAAIRNANFPRKLLVSGYDNTPAAREKVKSGELLCTVDQHAGGMAVAGIEAALEMHKNKTQVNGKTTPVTLVTAENVK